MGPNGLTKTRLDWRGRTPACCRGHYPLLTRLLSQGLYHWMKAVSHTAHTHILQNTLLQLNVYLLWNITK